MRLVCLALLAGTLPWTLLSQAPPSATDQTALLDQLRKHALAYDDSLPNFICTQRTHRSTAPEKPGKPLVWKDLDDLTIRLTYFGKKEDYQVVLVNGKPTDKKLSQVGGWSTTGDFGSMLRSIFREKSEAQFEWQRWEVWKGRNVAVLKWFIDQPHSQFRSTSRSTFHNSTVNWAAEGLVYADTETHQTLRVTLNALDIPAGYPVREFHLESEYAYQKIGDADFLLPTHSVSLTLVGKERRKFESHFTDYKKFSTDTEIKFGEIAK